jgi:hypothetical protein
MNESDWDSTDDVYLMWPVLTASRKRHAVQARNRKFRLMACAFCRDAWALLTNGHSRRAVEVAEWFADGQASAADLEAAKRQAWAAYCDAVASRQELGTRSNRLESNRGLAEHAAGWVAHKDPRKAAQTANANLQWVRYDSADPAAVWQGADLIREVFGNPFRAMGLSPACWTPTVLSLAQAAYDERLMPGGGLNPLRLAVLADALEEAGAGVTVLDHLRGPGRHVRGCHVVDALLGKS